jgi:hypothetical protein
VPLVAVALYASHSTIQMTMRYSHLVPKVNQAAVDAMDAFYEGGSGQEPELTPELTPAQKQVFKNPLSS